MDVSIFSKSLELYNTEIEKSADAIIATIKTLPKEQRCKSVLSRIFSMVEEKLDCTPYELR